MPGGAYQAPPTEARRARLELVWVGKDVRPRLEPRILIADPARSHGHAGKPGTASDNRLIFGDNLQFCSSSP